jgi:hypothetical protein
MPTIGLFGTCGASHWRDLFIAKYKELGIRFFNPQVENWNELFAVEEAQHLAEDEIVLFPITDETFGTGSLSEVGFPALQAIKLNNHRFFVVMITQDLDKELDNETLRRDSLKMRALVAQHLSRLDIDGLYIVDSLDEMLELSIKLHKIAVIKEEIRQFSSTQRQKEQ